MIKIIIRMPDGKLKWYPPRCNSLPFAASPMSVYSLDWE